MPRRISLTISSKVVSVREGPASRFWALRRFDEEHLFPFLAWADESRRRVEGNGASCFDLVDHGGPNTRLVDALWFSTGFDPLDDNAQGVRHVLGQYMQDRCILEIPSDGQVFSRGGRDMPYASITHADGVAYESTPGPC